MSEITDTDRFEYLIKQLHIEGGRVVPITTLKQVVDEGIIEERGDK